MNDINITNANIALQKYKESDNLLCKDDFYANYIEKDNKIKISFSIFLYKTFNQQLKGLDDKYTTLFNILNNDKKLQFVFLSGIKNIIMKNQDINFDYLYVVPRKQKDKYNKQYFTLQVGLQYQAQIEILTKLGYNFNIRYVMEGDEIKNIAKPKENGGFVEVIEHIQKDFSLNKISPDDFSKSFTLNDYKNKINEIYPKIQFCLVNVDKKGENSQTIIISKHELYSSLSASLLNNYNNNITMKDCYKNRNGLKATMDIAVIHFLYKKLILNSFEDEGELQEAQQIGEHNKEIGVEEKPLDDFENIEEEKKENKENKSDLF